MELQNRIGNLIQIDWENDLHELQPEGIKIQTNKEALKKSLTTHGFTLPFAVWKNGNKYYCIDGHTRKNALQELKNEGHEIPNTLPAFEVLAKNRKEAIKILVEVYNQKHNLFNGNILNEWLDIEEVEIENLDNVNVRIVVEDVKGEEIEINQDDIKTSKELSFFDEYIIVKFKDKKQFENFIIDNNIPFEKSPNFKSENNAEMEYKRIYTYEDLHTIIKQTQ